MNRRKGNYVYCSPLGIMFVTNERQDTLPSPA